MSYNTGSNYIHCTKVLFVIMIIHVLYMCMYMYMYMYLRSTMIEQHFNNLLLLNTHKEETDTLDLAEIANSFVSTIERQFELESFYLFYVIIIIIYFDQSLSTTMFVPSWWKSDF